MKVGWFRGWPGTARPRPDSLFTAALRNELAHLRYLLRRDLILWYVALNPVACCEATSLDVVFDAHFL